MTSLVLRSLVALLAGGSTLAPPAAQNGGAATRTDSPPPIVSIRGVVSPEDDHDRVSDLIRRGLKAQEKREYVLAESLLQEACLADRDPAEFPHLFLARLYDETHRDREAYEAYAIALTSQNPYRPFEFADPEMLVRYADLGLRFGSPATARRAYAYAVELARNAVGPNEPLPTPGSASLASLQAAASTAAGMRANSGGKEVEAIRSFEIAIRRDSRNWVPRYYLARTLSRRGDQKAAAKEALEAERLAPPAGRIQVRFMRWIRRLPNADGTYLPRQSIPPEPPPR